MLNTSFFARAVVVCALIMSCMIAAASPTGWAPTAIAEPRQDRAAHTSLSYVHPITGRPQATGVARGFDKPEHNWLPGHRGVDLFAHPGSPVVAVADGVVAFAGSVAGTPVISIDHPDGLRSTYQPVRSSVHAGDAITQGMVIGTLLPTADGSTGLHWGMLDGKDSYRNPLDFLAPPRIRLKPATSSR